MGNIVLGSDGIAIRQGIYEESSTKKTDLGRFIDFEDGRKFRYCKDGGSGITKAHMCRTEAVDGSHDDVLQTNYGLSIGDKDNLSIVLDGAPTVNEYADGHMIVNAGTGLGQIYKIRKNSATNPTKVWLYDAILVAVLVADNVTLVKNKYLDVCVTPASATIGGLPIGVPLITVTASYYFWAQTRGYAPLLVANGGTAVAGNDVGHGDTAGSCQIIADHAADPYYGKCVYAAAADDYAVIDLHLE